MGKRKLLPMILLISACMALGGCGTKTDEDEGIVLEDPNTAKEVKNLNPKQTEPPAPPETETETETETELQTEPPTEPPTEQPAEPQTEPPTEPPETPYSKDYDFSELSVFSAAFMDEGGVGNVPYTNTIKQDYQTNVRTEFISYADGRKTITLTADDTSGTTNKKVEFTYPAEEADRMASILIWLDDGITEKNIDKFVSGYYNGDGASLIGLKNAEYSNAGGVITVVLEKNPSAHGKVPGWTEDGSMEITGLTGSTKVQASLTDGTDIFSEILSAIDFGIIKFNGSEYTSYEKTVDNEGNVISSSGGFTASYESDNGNKYDITSINENPSGLMITVHRTDCNSSAVIMNIADYIYESFYDGAIDINYDIMASEYINEHCVVRKTDDGFSISLMQGKTAGEE